MVFWWWFGFGFLFFVLEKVAKGGFKMRKFEIETREAFGNAASAGQSNHGIASENGCSDLDGDCGRGWTPGAIQNSAKRLHKLGIGHGVWIGCVVDSGEFGVLECFHENRDHVVDVKPADPLLAVADAAAQSAFHELGEKGEGAFVFAENKSDSQNVPPGCWQNGASQFFFPRGANIGGPLIVDAGGFVADTLIGIAINCE